MGSDRPSKRLEETCACFNPRSHMGSDVFSLDNDTVINRVSIHAPTWGATQGWLCCHSSIWFQSTLPHGERQSLLLSQARGLCFNPRSHMGSDVSRLVLVNPDAEVSIHAPTWGATDMQDDIDRFNEVSIHAPTWGATLFFGAKVQ